MDSVTNPNSLDVLFEAYDKACAEGSEQWKARWRADIVAKLVGTAPPISERQLLLAMRAHQDAVGLPHHRCDPRCSEDIAGRYGKPSP